MAAFFILFFRCEIDDSVELVITKYFSIISIRWNFTSKKTWNHFNNCLITHEWFLTFSHSWDKNMHKSSKMWQLLVFFGNFSLSNFPDIAKIPYTVFLVSKLDILRYHQAKIQFSKIQKYLSPLYLDNLKDRINWRCAILLNLIAFNPSNLISKNKLRSRYIDALQMIAKFTIFRSYWFFLFRLPAISMNFYSAF